jgi:hypothetical protein
MKPRGWVRDTGTNARWGMQLGYDKTKVKQVPQRWP